MCCTFLFIVEEQHLIICYRTGYETIKFVKRPDLPPRLQIKAVFCYDNFHILDEMSKRKEE